ncbi:hypothetical protein TNCV_1385491 [Trichonephila clavipes]|nr:hypothetical protein TNCV_1385491 [Trichonephila clavipes]
MIPAYNKMRCSAFPFETGIHFRRKTDFFPEEDTTKSYSGFEPTRLQAEVYFRAEDENPKTDFRKYLSFGERLRIRVLRLNFQSFLGLPAQSYEKAIATENCTSGIAAALLDDPIQHSSRH